jgi:hypothetical protein
MAFASTMHGSARAGVLDSRILRLFLALTIFAGGFVFVEPAPYEIVFLAFFALTLIAGLKFTPLIAIQILCLVGLNIGGLIAATLLGLDMKIATYVAVSFYLALTAIVFAAIVGEDPERATKIIGRAWIAAAALAALLGIIGYFHLLPGADFFTLYGRARGTFEDPNVYGPFLILPALLLAQTVLNPVGGRTFAALPLLAVIVTGLLLSFSRAAWAHLFLSGVCLTYLMFITSTSNRFRLRITAMTALGFLASLALLAGLLSIPSVWEFFQMRATLVQDYDGGATGRFGTQLMALPDLLSTPLGLGPHEFGVRFGQDPHNVYINAFAAYGWLGGIAYVTYVILTLMLGLRFVFSAVPWQRFFIATLSAFVGLVLIGLVVDTDHWRHFYLLSGLIWGMAAANLAHARFQQEQPFAA